jgi:hypothetical protein
MKTETSLISVSQAQANATGVIGGFKNRTPQSEHLSHVRHIQNFYLRGTEYYLDNCCYET